MFKQSMFLDVTDENIHEMMAEIEFLLLNDSIFGHSEDADEPEEG